MYLSFCEALNFGEAENLKECNGAMACRLVTVDGKTTVKTFIRYDEQKTSSIELKRNYLLLSGGECPERMHKERKVLINFQCGTHLVSDGRMKRTNELSSGRIESNN